MTNSLFFLSAAAIGIFLIGANVAFLLQLGSLVTGWFNMKIAAVTGLLLYTTLSLTYGSPTTWRAAIGLGSVVLDMAALGWMWRSISTLKRDGRVGFIPLARTNIGPRGLQGEQGPQGEPGPQGPRGERGQSAGDSA